MFQRSVDGAAAAVEAARTAYAANNLAQWTAARARLDGALATASADRARLRAGDGDPATAEQAALFERTLAELEVAASGLTEPPSGIAAVSREAEIQAVLDARPAGSARLAYEQKERALKAEFAQLGAAECRLLATRLRRAQPGDLLAAQFHRMVADRKARLLAFLDDARRRDAKRQAVTPRLASSYATIGASASADPTVAPSPVDATAGDAPGSAHVSAAGALRGVADHATDERRAGADAQKLPEAIRGELESATGRSLGHVNVHAGEHGSANAAAHGARAVAIGNDIYMAEGQLDTERPEGRELLAHEVAHVVQHEAHPGPMQAAAKRDEPSEQAAEVDADSFAAQFRKRGGGASWSPAVSVGGSPPMRAPGETDAARQAAQPQAAASEATAAHASVSRPSQSVAVEPLALDELAVKPTHAEGVARAEYIYEKASSTAQGILGSLVPAYLAARDHCDAIAVSELGGRIIGAFTVVHGAKAALDEMLKALPHHSVRGEATDDLSVAKTQRFVEANAPRIEPLSRAVDASVASALTPHEFHGREVAGQTVVVSLDGSPQQRTARLTGELQRTVLMLQLIDELKAQLLDRKRALDKANLSSARGKLIPWASRPLDLAFLRAALGAYWDLLDGTAAEAGDARLSYFLGNATKQAAYTGWLGDIGRVDIELITAELRMGGRENAEFVIRNLYTADPDARAKLLMQLMARGLLDSLCSAVGWAQIKELHDSLGSGFSGIKTALQHYFIGKGKWGPDIDHEWDGHDRSLHSAVAQLGGVGGVLNFALDVGTFGFNSAYGKAIDDQSQGATSEAEARRAKMNVAAKTAAIAAVSMVTGGLADKLVRGGTTAVSVARAAAAGAAGGSVGGVSALATSDAYNNLSGEQRGFSSAEDYVKAAMLGGAIGGAVGGVTQGISNAVAERYLPRSSGGPTATDPRTPSIAEPPGRGAAEPDEAYASKRIPKDQEAPHAELPPVLSEPERQALIAKGATPRDLEVADKLVAMAPREARRLIDIYGEELLEYLRTQPFKTINEVESALVKQRNQVKDTVKGLYESTDEPPKGWHLDTSGPEVEPDGTRVVRTEVDGPNAARGLFVRAYNPVTKTLELRMAFLKLGGQDVALPNMIPRQGTAPELVAGKGTPTVQYITLHQMRWLGVPEGGGAGQPGVRQIHLSDIQNVETVVHLHYLRTTLGGALSDLVAFTPSVKYAETTAIQAGYVRYDAPVLTGGRDMSIEVLLNFQERGNPARVAENNKILERYGFRRDTAMRWGFDVDFSVRPKS